MSTNSKDERSRHNEMSKMGYRYTYGNCLNASTVTLTIEALFHDDGCTIFGVLEEFFSHVVGHAHTSVRGGISRQEASVHSNSVIEA